MFTVGDLAMRLPLATSTPSMGPPHLAPSRPSFMGSCVLVDRAQARDLGDQGAIPGPCSGPQVPPLCKMEKTILTFFVEVKMDDKALLFFAIVT